MTYTFPLATSAFMDDLGVEKVTWDTVEFREYDTQGSGHELDRRLAPDKWKATLVMRSLYNDEARGVAAVTRKTQGRAIMIYDPSNPYPANDPNGVALLGLDWLFASGSWSDTGFWYDETPIGASTGAATVQVASIGGDGQSMSLKGFPPLYGIIKGDKGQIIFASGARNYFFEFSETFVANGSGVSAVIDIYPPIPTGIAVDAVVILVKPACKMKVKRGGFAPGQSQGNMTFGTQLELLERL